MAPTVFPLTNQPNPDDLRDLDGQGSQMLPMIHDPLRCGCFCYSVSLNPLIRFFLYTFRPLRFQSDLKPPLAFDQRQHVFHLANTLSVFGIQPCSFLYYTSFQKVFSMHDPAFYMHQAFLSLIF